MAIKVLSLLVDLLGICSVVFLVVLAIRSVARSFVKKNVEESPSSPVAPHGA